MRAAWAGWALFLVGVTSVPAGDRGGGTVPPVGRTTIAHTSWQPVFEPTSGPNAGDITEIARGSSGTLLAVRGNSVILRSDDNFKSFTDVEYGQFYSLVAGTDSEFYVLEYGSTGWRSGTLWRSGDNGSSGSWKPIFSTDSARFLDVVVTLSGTVLIGCAEGVLRSTDDGISWANVWPDSSVSSLLLVRPSGNIFGLYHANGGARLIQSDDDGRTWSRVWPTNPPSLYFWGLGADSTGRLLGASGQSDGLWFSTDQGHTWESFGGPFSSRCISAVAADRSGRIYACAFDSKIATGPTYVGDGTGVWKSLEDKIPVGHANQIMTYGEETVFVATSAGVYYTPGETSEWSFVYPGTGVSEFYSLVRDTDGGLLTGTFVGTYRSTDEGVTWRFAGPRFQKRSTGFIAVTKQGSLIAGGYSLFRSVDHGDHWSLIAPDSAGLVQALCIDSAGAIFAADEKNLFRSTDEGNSWVRIPVEDKFGHYQLAAAPDGAMYSGSHAIGEGVPLDAKVLVHKSVDGGVHWQPILSIREAIGEHVNGFFFGRKDTILVLGSTHTYFSTDGGLSWRGTSLGPPYSISLEATSVVVDAQGIWYSFSTRSLVKSTDCGTSWISIDTNLPREVVYSPVSLLLDPNGRMYCTWNHLVYRTKAASMAFSQTRFDVPAAAESVYVRVANTGGGCLSWSTRDNVPWLRSDSDREDTIAIVVQENGSDSSRTGTVTVTSNAINSPLIITISQAGSGPTSIPEPTLLPSSYVLFQNFPNPFNPATRIRYGLPVTSRVRLTIFNMLGQPLQILSQEEKQAGYHEVVFDGSRLASGIYLVRFQAGSYTEAKKILLLR